MRDLFILFIKNKKKANTSNDKIKLKLLNKFKYFIKVTVLDFVINILC